MVKALCYTCNKSTYRGHVVSQCCSTCKGGWRTERLGYSCICDNPTMVSRPTCIDCLWANNADYYTNKAKAKIVDKRKAFERIARHVLIVEELGRIGLELPDHSRLCAEFIATGKILKGETVKGMVYEVGRMHYLYGYTDYPRVIRGAYYTQDEIKAIRNSYKIPELWPWLSNMRKLRGIVKILVIFMRHREEFLRPGGHHEIKCSEDYEEFFNH